MADRDEARSEDARRDNSRRDDVNERSARGAVFTSRGVSFALLAHPMVQGIRFLSKLALPWFLDPAEFGEAALASAILFGVQHVAVYGLDEALISAKSIDKTLFARMRRFQTLVGVMLAVMVVCAGFALRQFPSQEELGTLLIAFSPMTIVANRATLPTALLVRERCYARVFAVDLTAITTFTTVAVVSAALGAGAWSLVFAWHANAIAAMISASVFARPLMPAHDDGGEPLDSVKRRGAHFAGAAVLGYLGERADSMSIGFVLGRTVLALYEQAQNLAQVMVNYAASLSERLLFPTLAMHHREGGLGHAYLQALRVTLLFVLPLHVLLAALSQPLVLLVLPEEWHGAAPLLLILALVAAARCFDIASVTALKAAGHGRTVFKLGILRIALLVVALAFSLRYDARTVAAAVLASRSIAAGASLLVATKRLDLAAARERAAIGAAGTAFLLWALAFVPGAWYLGHVLEVASVPLLAVAPLLALILWLLARTVADRAALSAELAIVRARLERPNDGGVA